MSYTKEEYREWLASKPPEYLEELKERKRRTCARWYRENKERHYEVSKKCKARWYKQHRDEILERISLYWCRKHGQPWARLPVFYSFDKTGDIYGEAGDIA